MGHLVEKNDYKIHGSIDRYKIFGGALSQAVFKRMIKLPI